MTDDIVTRLRRFTANNADWPTIANAADEIERLRAERDEARRELLSEHIVPFAEAKRRGWDCFKEDKP